MHTQVARSSPSATAPRPGGKDFAGYLSEWLRGGGSLPLRSAAALAPEAERLLHEARAQRGRQPFFGQKAALHVLLVGDRRLAEQLQRVRSVHDFPGIFEAMRSRRLHKRCKRITLLLWQLANCRCI